MTTRNHRIRFMVENQVTSSNISSATANSSFPLSNLCNNFRHKLYKPTSMVDQWIQVDVGAPLPMGFVALIGPLETPFSISQGATFKILASNINYSSNADWLANAPINLAMSWSDLGGFRFLDDQSNYTYRYWRFYWTDPDNEIGSFSHIYVGEYQTLSFSNLQQGFQHTHIDPSVSQQSDGGTMYYRARTKYKKYDNMNIQYMNNEDYLQFEQIVFNQGTKYPFYVSIDPLLQISSDLGEMTRFVRFEREPTFLHVKTDTFSFTGLSLVEVE